jgi:hypothetical protein
MREYLANWNGNSHVHLGCIVARFKTRRSKGSKLDADTGSNLNAD